MVSKSNKQLPTRHRHATALAGTSRTGAQQQHRHNRGKPPAALPSRCLADVRLRDHVPWKSKAESARGDRFTKSKHSQTPLLKPSATSQQPHSARHAHQCFRAQGRVPSYRPCEKCCFMLPTHGATLPQKLQVWRPTRPQVSPSGCGQSADVVAANRRSRPPPRPPGHCHAWVA